VAALTAISHILTAVAYIFPFVTNILEPVFGAFIKLRIAHRRLPLFF
jgi:hypothetical protein